MALGWVGRRGTQYLFLTISEVAVIHRIKMEMLCPGKQPPAIINRSLLYLEYNPMLIVLSPTTNHILQSIFMEAIRRRFIVHLSNVRCKEPP